MMLWRGPPLADFRYEPFAQAEIARLEELQLACLEERNEARLALGSTGALTAELGRMVADHPIRERLRGQFMLALYRSGGQTEALETYREFRGILMEELGLEPSSALRKLEAAILRHDPVLVPGPAASGAPLAAGRSRCSASRCRWRRAQVRSWTRKPMASCTSTWSRA